MFTLLSMIRVNFILDIVGLVIRLTYFSYSHFSKVIYTLRIKEIELYLIDHHILLRL